MPGKIAAGVSEIDALNVFLENGEAKKNNIYKLLLFIFSSQLLGPTGTECALYHPGDVLLNGTLCNVDVV